MSIQRQTALLWSVCIALFILMLAMFAPKVNAQPGLDDQPSTVTEFSLRCYNPETLQVFLQYTSPAPEHFGFSFDGSAQYTSMPSDFVTEVGTHQLGWVVLEGSDADNWYFYDDVGSVYPVPPPNDNTVFGTCVDAVSPIITPELTLPAPVDECPIWSMNGDTADPSDRICLYDLPQ